MSYCVLIQDKIINEGDTIHIETEGVVGIGAIKIEVLKIDPESQSFGARLDEYNSEIDIPISIWENASIIENEESTDPNILFKFHKTK